MFKITYLSNALTGKNGDNETNIGRSKQLGLSFYADSDKKEIKVRNQYQQPFDFWIKRDLTGVNSFQTTFQVVNVSSGNMTLKGSFLNNGILLNGTNNSLSVQIKPFDLTLGYLIILKFGDTPVLNKSSNYFDLFKIFCPSNDLKSENGISYYEFFANMSSVRGFNGFVGFSVREINVTLCQNKAALNLSHLVDEETIEPNKTVFQDDLALRVVLSGCYYLDPVSGKWLSDGVEILYDSNSTHTHCVSTHLTSFAGGFVVLPAKIDFSKVWQNASFTKNPTIYVTCIVLVSLYVILAIWSRYQDHRDKYKIGITVLNYDEQDEFVDLKKKYLYEIIFFTGARKDAGTESKVKCTLSSELIETDEIELKDEKRKVFNRGGIDSFIYMCEKPLGNLTFLRVWHDNSGKENRKASWYLKYVIVHDLQSREKNYFICEKWLALDKEDGSIDRLLPVCGEAQKTQFKYLLSKQAKQKLSDGHLWFSIFARPAQSSFTRLDRLTCCFVLLCMSMLMNILYYGVDKTSNPAGLKVGPLNLTPEQVGIGVITNLIIFPPSLLLVQLFRRSKRRTSRITKLRNTLDTLKVNDSSRNEKGENYVESKGEKKSKKGEFKFPWWFKIFAYILSFAFASVSLFFIIVQGITFGDEKVSKWLTSLLVSFLTSIFLTQPLQVYKLETHGKQLSINFYKIFSILRLPCLLCSL